MDGTCTVLFINAIRTVRTVRAYNARLHNLEKI